MMNVADALNALNQELSDTLTQARSLRDHLECCQRARETAIAIAMLEEAEAWLHKSLRELGQRCHSEHRDAALR
ncbi:MAG: hypothetical protein HY329_00445 [Chloroflexi bacterium]|nr:hypothetical protein [Chloroflexota bacterium]